MKHPSSDEVMAAASAIGVVISEGQADLIARHAQWLVDENKRLNLTAIDKPDEVLRLHVVDSLAGLCELSAAPPGTFLDLGTGGGYPGVPLSVVSGRPVVLLDSTKKKSEALGKFILDSRWKDGRVVAERAEEHALSDASGYAAVVARAVTQMPSLVELATPLLSMGGHLIALKGPLTDSESRSGDMVANQLGMRKLSVRTFVLPGGGEERTVVVYERHAGVLVNLPRRSGMAQKRPLA